MGNHCGQLVPEPFIARFRSFGQMLGQIEIFLYIYFLSDFSLSVRLESIDVNKKHLRAIIDVQTASDLGFLFAVVTVIVINFFVHILVDAVFNSSGLCAGGSTDEIRLVRCRVTSMSAVMANGVTHGNTLEHVAQAPIITVKRGEVSNFSFSSERKAVGALPE